MNALLECMRSLVHKTNTQVAFVYMAAKTNPAAGLPRSILTLTTSAHRRPGSRASDFGLPRLPNTHALPYG